MLSEINVLKNCIKGKHDQCISKNCQCTCHEERDVDSLKQVKIIPKTYCTKCERNYQYELDFCEICARHLVRQPNYFQGKIKFADCIGNYEWIRWKQNKSIQHERYLAYQDELAIRYQNEFEKSRSFFNRIRKCLKIIRVEMKNG